VLLQVEDKPDRDDAEKEKAPEVIHRAPSKNEGQRLPVEMPGLFQYLLPGFHF
jgi:hypothetical protein